MIKLGVRTFAIVFELGCGIIFTLHFVLLIMERNTYMVIEPLSLFYYILHALSGPIAFGSDVYQLYFHQYIKYGNATLLLS